MNAPRSPGALLSSCCLALMLMGCGADEPFITSFSASPAVVPIDSTTTLTAVFGNGTGSVDLGVGPVTSGVGVQTVALRVTRTFTLTVTGRDGQTATARALVTVQEPFITSFAAFPSTVTAGSSATLIAVFGEGTGRIDHGIGVVASGVGVTTGPLQAATTYTLRVGTVTATTTVLVGQGTFAATGSMLTPRNFHTSTLLPDGRVLVAGGTNAVGPLASAELYDPATGLFTPTGSMTTARYSHTATLVDGRVLITGGGSEHGDLRSAELYDPATGIFMATGPMATERSSHTATLLPGGKILVAGGWGTTTAELYDPATGKFAATGSTIVQRVNHTATLLNDGKVLLVGGGGGETFVAEVEQYEPATGAFTPTGSLKMGRARHTASLLPDGRVLVAGGGHPGCLDLAELYDPATGASDFAEPMGSPRCGHTATTLLGGKVLFASGVQSFDPLQSPDSAQRAELFDPATGRFSPAGNLVTARSNHAATRLLDGTVLITGGYGIGARPDVLSSAELYTYQTYYPWEG